MKVWHLRVAGLLGGYTSGILTLMSYLAAITAAGQRTLRVGLLESMTFLGSFVGPFVGTLVSENAGRTWTFCTLVIINAAIVLYVVVRLPEVPPPRPLPAATSTAAKLARVRLWRLRAGERASLRFFAPSIPRNPRY